MRLALDIGGTAVKCAAVNDKGEIVHDGEFRTRTEFDTEDFGRFLVDGARGLMGRWGGEYKLVGAGMAGFADGKKGMIYESPNMPGVKDFELARVLREGLELPAYIDNDATVAAWGEFLLGGHGEIQDMLVVTLGTGIGGGLVLDGRVYRGAHGMAGGSGPRTYEPAGPQRPGGPKGCLEYFVGKAGLMEDYRSRSELTDTVAPRIIHERAVDGDSAAVESWNQYGHHLGVILASSANLLDLGAVILTGGLAGAWDQFQESLTISFKDHLIAPLKESLTVTLTTLSGNAGILGAAFLDRANSKE